MSDATAILRALAMLAALGFAVLVASWLVGAVTGKVPVKFPPH